MAGEHSEDQAQWRARFEAAGRDLDSVAGMVALRRSVTAAAGAAPRWIVPPVDLGRARVVGLFSASFNPLTEAHEALVAQARPRAGLDLVVWAMARVTVDKERVERATTGDRLAQVRAALGGRSGEALALLGRGLYVDQARALRAEMAPDARLAILLGYDKIAQIFDPRYYDDRERALSDLFALAEVWVAPRASGGEAELRALLAQPENAPYAAQVRYLPLPARFARDSSTEARERAATLPQPDPQPGRDPLLRGLLPPAALALTALGPYAPPRDDPPDDYTLRVLWLRALEALAPEELGRVPALRALVRATRERLANGGQGGQGGQEGRALGVWLRAETFAGAEVTAWLARLGL